MGKNKRKGYRNNPASQVFDRDSLARICTMDEYAFGDEFADMLRVEVPEQGAPYDFMFYRQTDSPILFVAHLDTVARASTRKCHFVDTNAGPLVISRALDDRLGAYIGLEMLPALGIETDILLTTGEEVGQSTAAFFDPDKDYNWVIEFDRMGDDVVMYQYDSPQMRELVRDCGAYPGDGIFSDISYLDHLEVKCFNWGCGYQEYHTARSHAWLNDTFSQVNKFAKFYEQNHETVLPHLETYDWTETKRGRSFRDWRLDAMTDEELELYFSSHYEADESDSEDSYKDRPDKKWAGHYPA